MPSCSLLLFYGSTLEAATKAVMPGGFSVKFCRHRTVFVKFRIFSVKFILAARRSFCLLTTLESIRKGCSPLGNPRQEMDAPCLFRGHAAGPGPRQGAAALLLIDAVICAGDEVHGLHLLPKLRRCGCSILPEKQNIMFPQHTKKAPKHISLGAFPWLFIIFLLAPGSQQPGSPGCVGDPTV